MITDGMLREAAKESLEDYVKSLERDYDSERPHQFSKKFEKKIERLKRRANHPVLYKTMHRVASVVLAILITGGAWMTVDTEARAAFFGWIKEVYETYFVYRFEDNSDANKEWVDYRPTLIPNGYTEFYSDTTEDTIIVVYANEEGEMLKFSYIRNPDETDWFVGTDQLIVEQIMINDIPAELVTSTEPETASAVMWTTADNTAFNVSGFLTSEELIAIAKSVQPIKN